MANFKRGSPNYQVLRPVFVEEKTQTPQSKDISLETHHYDGKLLDMARKIQKAEIDDKMEMFQEFEQFVHSPYFGKMKHDDYSRNGANYDNTNNVDAVDILVEIFKRYKTLSDEKKKDLLQILNSQIEDMVSGFCSQGRCTRLLQVFFVFDF